MLEFTETEDGYNFGEYEYYKNIRHDLMIEKNGKMWDSSILSNIDVGMFYFSLI